jgi:hypothetical protein
VSLARRLSDLLTAAIYLERRVDPYFRPQFDRMLQQALTALVQAAINARRRGRDPHLGLAEERMLPHEEEVTAAIVDTMAAFTRLHYAHAPPALRAGNTKTYGVVRGQFEVRDDVARHMRRGLFREPGVYPAWVRFAGPGPLAPPDLRDNGVLSIGVKVMGVAGETLLAAERSPQDVPGISAPTFTTPNIVENLKLQRWSLKGTPIFYFLDPFDSHLLDGIMQGLYAKTQLNPLEERYWSCTAYLLGEGQAMHYSVSPRSDERTPFPRHPSDNYLREAMARTLHAREVTFDFSLQLQTDAFRMPIEDASVMWPERLSPFVPVARLRLPVQTFDSPAQLAFADNLSFNPWHSVPEHRPLGNQNRARKTIYLELSKLRQSMNGSVRLEPTGDEVFP